MRILFVDDEPRILDALRRLLRPKHDWELSFATSGMDALAILGAASMDVVVSDMRMPGMDGAALLAAVKRKHPETIRIVLSGQADITAMLHAFGVTHRFMAKPCDVAVLESIIDGVRVFRQQVGNPALQEIVNGTTALPCHPVACRELVKRLQTPGVLTEDIAAIAVRDVGMTASIMKVANSTYFSGSSGSADLGRALNFLGLEVVRALILEHGVLGSTGSMATGGVDLTHLRDHSLRTAAVARALAPGHAATRGNADLAYLTGLVHDVGQLVLASAMPERYQAVADRMRVDGLSRLAAEREVLDSGHGEVGAYLLTLWGFEPSLAEALAFHEHPGDLPGNEFGLAGLIHVAHQLAAHPECSDAADPALGLDVNYLARTGVLECWPAWRAAAAAIQV